MMRFTDSHCHFDFPDFAADASALLHACAQRGVSRLLVPGVSATQWQRLSPWLAARQQDCPVRVYGAFGLHPCYVQEHEPAHLHQLPERLQAEWVVAVGEIGLDGTQPDMPKQIRFLTAQLALANDAQLPVILHQRQAHNELIRALKHTPPIHGGVVHAFSGSLAMAQEYIALGLKMGLGGVMTYPRAAKTRATVQALAAEHLLLETDGPDMPLFGYQGVRNSPVQVPNVFRALCALRDVTEVTSFAAQLEANVDATFPRLTRRQ